MSGKTPKPYMENNWRLIKGAPLELFPTPTFQEFMEERVESWEIKPQYVSINRVYNAKSGKVTEKAYKQVNAAQEYLANKLNDINNEIATATHTELYFFGQDGTDDE